LRVSAPEPPVRVSFPLPPDSVALGSGPFVSSSSRLSLPPSPETRTDWMVVMVAGDPVMGTVPLFTSRLPAALRETVMALALLSPVTVSTPPAELAVTA
jgi:hypothetical protein